MYIENAEIIVKLQIGTVVTIILLFVFMHLYRKLKIFIENWKKRKKKHEVVICGGLKTSKRRRRRKKYIITSDYISPTIPIIKKSVKKPKLPKPKKIDLILNEIKSISYPKEDLNKKLLEERWSWLLSQLKEGKKVRIDCNYHFGELRGNDILLKAKKDLKRLGYKVKLSLKDSYGEIWLD